MANPNIVNVTTIYGKTTGANLTTTGAATVLNNPSDSNIVLKVNTFNVSNYTASAVNITVNFIFNRSISPFIQNFCKDTDLSSVFQIRITLRWTKG